MSTLEDTITSITRSRTGAGGPIGWHMPAKDYAMLCQEMSDVQAAADQPVFFQGPNGIFYVDAKERFHPIPGLLVASVPVYPYEVS